MKIYDSVKKELVDFVPLKKGEVSMYVCGPTVYDVGHLGHGRSAVAFDVIRRYFEYKGLKIKFVSNYTDIDDKMINRAKERGISVSQLANEIIPEYEKDYGALGVKKPTVQPKATEHIDEIIELIKKMEEKSLTYVISGDGVYYDISKFPEYGKLSGQNLDELEAGARVDVNEKKKNPYDFVVWKFKKEGEPSWKSPWGEGRPGWHIECSAMTLKHLGKSFDIHGGGLDLKFPHHECEIAQSKGVYGEKSFAKYWMHNGFININNEKMSKSLGNFFTLKDIFKKYDPQVVRMMFLQTHYRNPINFSEGLLEQAKAALEKLHDFVRKIKLGYEGLNKKNSGISGFKTKDVFEEFEKFMDNDFDTSGALSVVYNVISNFNSAKNGGKLSQKMVDEVMSFLEKTDAVLGIIFPEEESEKVSSEITDLIKQREEARKNKDYKTSDKIRDELLKKGVVLEDTSNGTIWKKA